MSPRADRSHPDQIELALDEIRSVAGFSVKCASRVLPLYEEVHATDPRPHCAIAGSRAFAEGGPRRHSVRKLAMDAYRAGKEAATPAASLAAHAASQAAAVVYLHPLAQATQLKHLLGSAAYAVAAAEADAGSTPDVSDEHLEWIVANAPRTVVTVLGRYPPAPAGGGRVGELLRGLDAALRG